MYLWGPDPTFVSNRVHIAANPSLLTILHCRFVCLLRHRARKWRREGDYTDLVARGRHSIERLTRNRNLVTICPRFRRRTIRRRGLPAATVVIFIRPTYSARLQSITVNKLTVQTRNHWKRRFVDCTTYRLLDIFHCGCGEGPRQILCFWISFPWIRIGLSESLERFSPVLF